MVFSDYYKNVLITTNDSLNAKQLEDYLSEKLKKREFPKNSKIILLAGCHHEIDRNNTVKPNKTEFALLQGFYFKVFSTLAKIEDPPKSGKFIWDEMNYQRKVIPIANKESCDLKTFKSTYELSDLTKADLKDLAKGLLKSKRSCVIVFASCYSFGSSITDFLISKTVLSSLKLSKDKGELSGGKSFGIDNEQREILVPFLEVLYDCLFGFLRMTLKLKILPIFRKSRLGMLFFLDAMELENQCCYRMCWK